VNDDAHHCLHVLLSGESDTYYADYARQPHALLCAAWRRASPTRARPRATRRAARESSTHLPPSAFVNFLQNHDQIGNRARGERLTALVPNEAALRAAAAVLLLAPAPPLLFMGEEWRPPSLPVVLRLRAGAGLTRVRASQPRVPGLGGSGRCGDLCVRAPRLAAPQ